MKANTTPEGRITSRRFGRLTRTLVALTALGSTVGIGLLATAGTASATALIEPPTFECYHANGLNLDVDALPVASDGLTTLWEPVIYEWSGKTWVVIGHGYLEQFSDTAFGLLANLPQDFHVALNHYYAVTVVTASAGQTTAQDLTAQALMGGAPVGSGICRT